MSYFHIKEGKVLKNSLFFLLILMIFLSFEPFLGAVPRRMSYDEENNVILRQIYDSIDDLRREANNHESEIHVLGEKLNNYDTIIDAVKKELFDGNQFHRSYLKETSEDLNQRITSLEKTVKALAGDLRQFKTQANESANAVSQYKQKIADLEKVVNIQNQNLENLQAALQSTIEALQIKSKVVEASSTTGTVYQVKSGDSLEKIAKKHQTTIQALKELNNLTTDRIKIGQSIQVP